MNYEQMAGPLVERDASSLSPGSPDECGFDQASGMQNANDRPRHRCGISVCRGGKEETRKQPSLEHSYLPTKCPTSFSFSSQTYSISSVSVSVNRRFTVHGLV